MERKLVLKKDIVEALKAVGVRSGQTVMVHTSLSSLGFVCGGAQTVIEALLECVGEEGTIMMPTQSWKNLDPESGVHWEEPKEWWQAIRDNWPSYDKDITPTNTMGAVAEMFRRWPGALRSNHPARSVAAYGKYAQYLTENHDLSNIFGDGSPIGKLYELDGYVLLIGVGYDKNTSLHLADMRAQYPGKHLSVENSAVMENGERVWKTYETLYVDGEDFEEIGEAFEREADVRKTPLGNGMLTFMKQRQLVDFAVEWIQKNRRSAIPQAIRELIGDRDFRVDSVGMSNSQVLCFDDMILKIEKTNEEADHEQVMMKWLGGRLPVPEVLAFERKGGCNYLLMSRLPGKMSCDEIYMENPRQLIHLLAEGLKTLWSVDIEECPLQSGLDWKLRLAKAAVGQGLCSMEDAEESTYGEGGFEDPAALLAWLKENRPEEDLVFSHGDYCLPNLFLQDGKVSGFLDLGRSGIADRYQDIALCYRSLKHNYSGRYGGKVYADADFRAESLFEELGIEPDWEKIRYYILLDELF